MTNSRGTAMRVRELTAFQMRIPLKSEIRHASHARTENDTLIVRCRLENGCEGWGEGLPRPYVTGETIDSAWQQLRATDFRRELGEPVDGLPGAMTLAEQFQLASLGPDDRGCFGNSVRCAIELSLLDAACRAEGVPLSTVTELVPETAAIRDRKERVRYGAAFTAMSRLKTIKRAIQLRAFGFHQAKVKVGVEGYSDRAVLRRLRWVLGSTFDLRIDANEAWRCDNLEHKIEPLRKYGITSVEQPVPHAEVACLARLRPRLGVPIMLDESLCSRIDAQRAVEQGTCDLFNIRLSKCGGFLNSLKLAAMAHQAGLGYQLGCQVGETGILSAAGRHFATSVANIRYLEGSYDRFLVAERLTVEDLTFGWGGYAPALTAPGLGISIDAAALERTKIAEERWTL